MLLLALACVEPSPGVTPPTGSAGNTAATTDPCRVPDPAQAATVQVEPVPDLANAVALEVSLAVPGAVQVRCVHADDPADVVWAWSGVARTLHSLQVAALRWDVEVDCEVAPVCPAGPTVPLHLPAEPTPQGFPRVTVAVSSASARPEWTVASHTGSGALRLTVFDGQGRSRWTRNAFPFSQGLDTAVQVDGDELVFGGGYTVEADAVGVMGLDGGVRYGTPSGDRMWHHHAERLSDGTLLSMTHETDRRDMEEAEGFSLVAWDPSSDPTVAQPWTWRSQDAVDRGWLDFRDQHANWWTLDPERGRAWVSLCAARELVAIDVASGEVAWRTGPGHGLTLVDGAGAPLADDAWPRCQHGVEVLDPDAERFLMVDNSRDFGPSRVVELEVDRELGQARLLWSWQGVAWQSDVLGDVEVVDPERLRVTNGAVTGLDGPVFLVEVERSTGEVLWRLDLPGGGVSWLYRIDSFDPCLLGAAAGCPGVVERLPAGEWP